MSESEHDMNDDQREHDPAPFANETQSAQGEQSVHEEQLGHEEEQAAGGGQAAGGEQAEGDAEAQEALRELEQLISRLQGAAEQLRSGDLSTDAAATLVEECAVLANRAGAELDRLGRAGHAEGAAGQTGRFVPAPGQDSLL